MPLNKKGPPSRAKSISSKTLKPGDTVDLGNGREGVVYSTNDIQRVTVEGKNAAVDLANHLAAGGNLADVNAPSFVRLPDNITLNADGTVTLPAHGEDPTAGVPAHADLDLPAGTELPTDIAAHSVDPSITAESVGGFANEQAPVLPVQFYSNGYYGGDEYVPTIISRANKLAAHVWGSPQERSKIRYSNVPDVEPEELTSVMMANDKQHHRYGAMNEIRRMLSVTPSNSLGGFTSDPFASNYKIEETIRKLKRLEKKYSREEIIDDEGRDRIIDKVLMPSSVYGVSNEYHGWGSVDLLYPPQKAQINELLTREELGLIGMVINYLPRMRVLLRDFDFHHTPMKEEELLHPLVAPVEQRYYQAADERKFLNTMKKVHQFLGQSIPGQVQEDFIIPNQRATPAASHNQYVDLQKASAKLREASLGYVQETKPLSELLEAIMELSSALIAYYMAVNEEITNYYTFLNRIGVAFVDLVRDSEERIRNSNVPW